MAKNTPRKSVFETVPGYLTGLAAAATAAVSVLTFLHFRPTPPEGEQTTTPVKEPHAKSDEPTTQSPPDRIATPVVQSSAPAAAPTLASALRPNRCAPYVDSWRLSSGELLTLLDNERLQLTTSGEVAPKFGRWTCSGRDGELLYVTPDRERTIVFTASGDSMNLYQRASKSTVTPLTASRESATP